MYYLCLSNIWPETFAAKNPSRNPSIASTLSQLRSRGLIVILLNAMLLVVKIHLIIKMSAIATMLNSVDQYDGNGSGGDVMWWSQCSDNLTQNCPSLPPQVVQWSFLQPRTPEEKFA